MTSGSKTAYPNVIGAMIGLASLAACAEKPTGRAIAGADPDRGLALIESSGCGACHQIPSVKWPRGQVGGSLVGFADRTLIAGRHPNQPDTLVRWLRDPPALSPDTAMPASNLTEAQARDVAAYLYTLHDE